MPVYLVNPGKRLVRANNAAQAIRFVAQSHFRCEVAKGDTIAELMSSGVKCEDARQPETADLVTEAELVSKDNEVRNALIASEGHSDIPNPEGRTRDEYLEGIASRGAPQNTIIEEVDPK